MEAYRDQYATLFNNGKKVVVIGISVDPDTALANWARESGFPNLFASDPDQTVAKMYGSADAERQFDTRNVFIVGPDGRIAIRIMKFNVLSGDAYTELQKAVAADDQARGRLALATDAVAPPRRIRARHVAGVVRCRRRRRRTRAGDGARGRWTAHRPREPRVWMFAFGKAAQPMAAAAVGVAASLAARDRRRRRRVSRRAAPAPYPTLVADARRPPVPGRNSFAAARRSAKSRAGRRGNDVAIVLISGGASSLIGAPLRGMNEADLTLLYELLLGSGLDIASMNAVRKRFSRWGAGRLALALAPAATHCLAISDVAGDDLARHRIGPVRARQRRRSRT